MPTPLIQVCSVSKRFRRGEHFDSLRDLIIGRLFRARRRRGALSDHFWAVHDVTFAVDAGECFGVIGHNGAGKSTLLKLMAGIMRPNRGRIDLHGRVAALIELSAGFHPDLTGRENVYLNAAIYGLKRAEVHRRFDEIVDFAGIEEFLDTPVKRYSSGMQARLGFSVAVHTDPRILLVDEVLSVGDLAFRARCMERINAFLRGGAAVVYVTHDLETVAGLCGRALLLTQGRAAFMGPAAEATARFHDANARAALLNSAQDKSPVHVRGLRLLNGCGRPVETASPGSRLCLEFDACYATDMAAPSYGLYVMRMSDHLTFYETSSSRLGVRTPSAARGGRHRVRMEFSMNVAPGEYSIGFHVRDHDSHRYALDRTYAVPVRVRGPEADTVEAGPAFLEPRVEFLPAADTPTAAAALREGCAA